MALEVFAFGYPKVRCKLPDTFDFEYTEDEKQFVLECLENPMKVIISSGTSRVTLAIRIERPLREGLPFLNRWVESNLDINAPSVTPQTLQLLITYHHKNTYHPGFDPDYEKSVLFTGGPIEIEYHCDGILLRCGGTIDDSPAIDTFVNSILKHDPTAQWYDPVCIRRMKLVEGLRPAVII